MDGKDQVAAENQKLRGTIQRTNGIRDRYNQLTTEVLQLREKCQKLEEQLKEKTGNDKENREPIKRTTPVQSNQPTKKFRVVSSRVGSANKTVKKTVPSRTQPTRNGTDKQLSRTATLAQPKKRKSNGDLNKTKPKFRVISRNNNNSHATPNVQNTQQNSTENKIEIVPTAKILSMQQQDHVDSDLNLTPSRVGLRDIFNSLK